MIRRSPTRIDLRLDDLAEYETLKKEQDEAKKKAEEQAGGAFSPQSWGIKPTQVEIQERIGYVPQTPAGSSSSNPRSNSTM